MIRMISMRLKSGPSVSSEWRCFFCLHVRTATIIYGVWHLILHVLILFSLAIIARNHNLLDEARLAAEFNEQNDAFEDNTIEDLPTPLSKIDHTIPLTFHKDHSLYYTDLDMAGLVSMFTLTFNLLLIYGAIKGKATPLLPFFCLQLFDFAVSTLTATGYACYMRSMHRLVAETWQLPFRNYLLQLSPQCLSLVVLLAFIVSMIIKAYCIGIVWRCYKYLTLRQQALRSAIHYIMPGDIATERVAPQMEPDYSSLLPDYEAACKQTPPPSYQAALAAQVIHTTADNTTTLNNDTSEITVTESVQPVQSPTAAQQSFAHQVTTVAMPQIPSANGTTTDAVPPVEQQVK